jgi:transposase
MFHLTYEFKLKPTTRQIEIFENWLEQCRRVYNYALAERKHWFGLVVVKLTLALSGLNLSLGPKRSDQLMRANAKA